MIIDVAFILLLKMFSDLQHQTIVANYYKLMIEVEENFVKNKQEEVTESCKIL